MARWTSPLCLRDHATSDPPESHPQHQSDPIHHPNRQVLPDNPLADFVELPEEYKGELKYSQLLCGVIRGALEMVGWGGLMGAVE